MGLPVIFLAAAIALGLAYVPQIHAQARAQTQAPSPELEQRGAEIFKTHCAVCHERALDRVPPKSVLSTLAPESVYRALTSGVMKQNAAGLSDDELRAVVVHLTGKLPGADVEVDLNANRCQNAAAPLAMDSRSWSGWGGQGLGNARYQAEPGFGAADVPRLRLKWAFAYPGGPAGQPVVLGHRVFVAGGSGYIYALDADSGCTHWARDLGAPSNIAISIGRLPSGKFAVYLGGIGAEVRALDADTGTELWRTRVDEHPTARLNGGFGLFEGRLYVPVSSSEEVAAANPAYHCCNFRGSVVALDAVTGRQLWKSYAIEQAPQPLANDPARMAPAGAAVWTAPAIDAKRRLIYVGTGDAYTEPVTPESDAVMAFALDTGVRRWVHQLVPDDAWLVGCEPTPHVNCPKNLGPDFDLDGPILAKLRNGKEVLVASSKSGLAWGLDVDRQGKVLWETRVGQGGTRGGIEWGGATDGERVYFPISDAREGALPSTKANAGNPTPGGVNGLSVATGKLLWHTPVPTTTTCGWGKPCVTAQPGAPSLMPGVVFAGSWDGHERAYATANGRIVWDFDTGQTFDSVNGPKATGGSIDRGSQTIANGALYVNSGVRMRIGNALLVFTVDGK